MKKILATIIMASATLATQAQSGANYITSTKATKAQMPAMPRIPYEAPITPSHPRTLAPSKTDNGLTADFSIQDGTSQVTVWSENFDSEELDPKGHLKMEGWTFDYGEGDVITFTKEQSDFSTIDEADHYSMHIDGPYQVYKRTKGWAQSPDIAVPANGQLHAWVRMNKMWNDYVVLRLQVSADGFETSEELWNSTMETESGSHWVKVDADLAAYVGKTVALRFFYGPGTNDTFNTGGYMGDFYVDGLTVTGVETVSEVSVMTGDIIQFADMSEGSVERWEWLFPGGTPSASSEQHPAVYYEKAGDYDVTLTVYDGESHSATVTKQAFVKVEGQAPVAGVDFPADFRDLTTRMRMVAPFALVDYRDASTGFPDEFSWTFYTPYDLGQGAFFHPDTVYTTRDVSLRHERQDKNYVLHIAQNEMGYSFVDDSVCVKFQGLVTNFRPVDGVQTNFVADGMTLPGANDMGITAWAERFSKPAAPVVLEGMYVNFTKASAEELIDQIAGVSFSLYDSKDGLPGNPIALLDTWTMSELNYAMNTNNGVVTVELSAPIVIDSEVFVVIDGIPEKNDQLECAIGMAPLRSEGNTAYMLNKGVWRPLTGFFDTAPGGQTSLAVFPYYTYSVVVPAQLDDLETEDGEHATKVTVGADSIVVDQKAGKAELYVYANRGLTQYGQPADDWLQTEGEPGEYTVDTLTVAYAELPEGMDRRETRLTVTDGVTELPLRVIQQRVAEPEPVIPTAISGMATEPETVELYDLQGRRTDNSSAQRGVRIVRRGSHVSKRLQ